MALIEDLFARSEKPQRGLLAVETIGLIYNLLTSLLIVCFYNRMNHPETMLIEHAGILSGTMALYLLYRGYACKMTLFFRVVGQLGLLAYWYPETYEFNRLFPNLDHLFAGWEQMLFDCQPAITFSQYCSGTLWSEAFNLGYFSYYPMIFAVVLFYFFARNERFLQVSFVVLGSFFVYYLIYMFLPVTGPQYYFHAIGLDTAMAGIFPEVGDYFSSHCEMLPGPGDADGLFYGLVEQSQAAGERPTAAFPSSHVGISTILMILAWRGKRMLFAVLLPFYLLLCFATVYIQAHYLIDALAGFVSAIVVFLMVEWLYDRFWGWE